MSWKIDTADSPQTVSKINISNTVCSSMSIVNSTAASNRDEEMIQRGERHIQSGIMSR